MVSSFKLKTYKRKSYKLKLRSTKNAKIFETPNTGIYAIFTNYETTNITEIKIIIQNNKMLNYFLPKVSVKIAEG